MQEWASFTLDPEVKINTDVKKLKPSKVRGVANLSENSDGLIICPQGLNP